MQYLVAISKTTEWFLFLSRQTIEYKSNWSLCPISNAEETEVKWFYEDLLELTPEKDDISIIGDWNSKVGSQEIPGVTGKFGLGVQNKAGRKLNRALPRERTGHSKHLLAKHKRRLYQWMLPDCQYRNQIDYILCSRRWRSSLQSAKTRPEVDYGSNHELSIAIFRLNLKKVGKTNRPLKYDLNQIPYNHTVEETNKFTGSDLTDRVTEELWMEVGYIIQEVVTKTILRKRNARRQNGCLGRPYK